MVKESENHALERGRHVENPEVASTQMHARNLRLQSWSARPTPEWPFRLRFTGRLQGRQELATPSSSPDEEVPLGWFVHFLQQPGERPPNVPEGLWTRSNDALLPLAWSRLLDECFAESAHHLKPLEI